MKQLPLTSPLVIGWLTQANLCPFSGQLKESRALVNDLAKTKFAQSKILGNQWILSTSKGYQSTVITFADVQGCGFDKRPISSLK